MLVALGAAPAGASVLLGRSGVADEPRMTRIEARQYHRWWGGEVLSGSLAISDMPLTQLQAAAELAWAAGVSREHLRAALFTDAARNLLAGNAAGGEARPSPYLEYFRNNPVQLGGLGEFLLESPTYEVGPGGTQEQLFARFPGLRESYLASLGLREVNGRIVDPRNPYLTPYLTSMLMGPPQPLPQPAVSLNVVAP
jgi:hypothetical protein